MHTPRPLVLGLALALAVPAAWAADETPAAQVKRVPVGPHASATFPLAAGDALSTAPGDTDVGLGLPTMVLDSEDSDPSKPACADFAAHANGRWLKAHPIPTTWNTWGTWTQLEARQLEQWRALVEGAAASATDDPMAARVATFYAAAMNAEHVDQLGSDPVWPQVEEIDALAKPADILAYLAREHRNGRQALFRLEVRGPLKGEDHAILTLVPSPLGLPDVQTYTQPSREATGLLGAYEAHISRSLQLARISKIGAQTAAESVRAIETRLAAALKSEWDKSAPSERLSAAALAERYPATDWPGYLAALGIPDIQQVELVDPAFFAAIDALLAELPTETWRDYLRWSVVRPLAPYLSVGFTDAEFLLYQSRLGGRQAPAPRWRQMIELTAWAFPEWVGRRYLDTHLDQANVVAAREVVDSLRDRFKMQIEAAKWLSADSRKHAREALDTLDVRLAEPVQWPAPNDAEIAADDLVGNIRRTQARQMKRELARLGADSAEGASAADRSPFALHISYDPEAHRLFVPLALLQPPLLSADGPAALDLGAFGALLGAAMHAAVEQRASPHWSSSERRKRQQHLDALGKAYAQFRIEGAGIRADRAAPLALADLAGLSLALDALAVTEDPAYKDFFGAWARLWRGQQSAQAVRIDLLAGALPWRLRSNGPLGHLPEFAKAFGCTPGENGLPSTDARIRPW